MNKKNLSTPKNDVFKHFGLSVSSKDKRQKTTLQAKKNLKSLNESNLKKAFHQK